MASSASSKIPRPVIHHLFFCPSAGVQPEEACLAPVSQARGTESIPFSPCILGGDQSPEGEPQAQLNTCLRLRATFPPSTQLVPAAANSAGLGLFCSHHKATRGCSARMACNPSAPSCHPWPTLTHPTAHSGSSRSPHSSCHTRWRLRPLLGGQAEQGGGASPNLPTMLPGKWSRPLPQGGMHLLGALSCPLQPQGGVPFCFQLHGNLYSPASPGEGRGQRQEGQRPPLNAQGMWLSFFMS